MEVAVSRSGDIGEEMFRKLDDDTIIHVLNFMDTPRDLASAACVSQSWRRYVSEGGLWRELCIKNFPEIGSFEEVVVIDGDVSPVSCELSLRERLEREYHVYSHLLSELQAPPYERSCIIEPLHASSTDNFPRESIAQTLLLNPRYPDGETPSYWSSKGQTNADVPETLTYLLNASLCVIHEVKIRPFLAYFQLGDPIYSAKSVRFRFGYSKSPRPRWGGLLDSLYASIGKNSDFDDDYIWTYESPEFSMAQEDIPQTFNLPRPVLCIGGVFQIELLGRVQTQLADGKYYICVSHVSVHGRPLTDYDFVPVKNQNKYLLKYCQKDGDQDTIGTNDVQAVEAGSSRWNSLAERFRQLRNSLIIQRNRSVFDTLLGNVAVTTLLVGDDEDSDGGDDETFN